MKLARGPVAIALFASAVTAFPLAAAAADEARPVAQVPVAGTGVAAGTAGTAVPAPAVGLADLPENQAEAAAIAAGDLQLARPETPAGAAAEALPVEPAQAARRAALDAVLAEQAGRVRALVARLPAADDAGALEIQRQVEQVKKETGRRLLEVQLELATGTGDQVAIDNLQAALADWDAPQPVRQPVDRPVPHNQGR
ncbi:MAG: hypothetical protein IPK64_04945 [bacterium]|nr:hypothetical protein [bacterium]